METTSSIISCIVVDDEPIARELLTRYINRTPFLALGGVFENGIQVLAYLEDHAPDVVFLDIDMPDLNGMELSQSLADTTKIIFVTAHDNYAVAGYRVNALDYLLKPVDYAEFLRSAQKAKSWFMQRSAHERVEEKVANSTFIFVKSEYKIIKIHLSDIIYVEGLKDYVKLYTKQQASPILSKLSLKSLESELPTESFMRVHRSYIVCLSEIAEIERNQLIIGGIRITVADQYKADFKRFLDARML